MKKILIINGHQPYSFSPGRLTQSLIETAAATLQAKGYEVRYAKVSDYDVEAEVAKHQWADAVLLQFPSNWMMVPWSCKKYIDEVYTAGMAGVFCDTDGRSAAAPKQNYGTGGLMHDKHYMLCATFNAPAEAFGNPAEYLFQGKSLDDLLFPVHCVYRFFAMHALPSFACYDVVKNPTIKQDLADFAKHIDKHF
ncbi:NAD(P)H-dependent oxidoreductase [Uruburuella testudinis]|uniref:Flavodoxin n=2 Tax=Pseudomonadota TaxID=1224 RepID=A0A0A3ASH4_9PAST|nr:MULTISPECIES: NAD(P)H-dependent oxidoreductase [Pseudomonadota]KGQ70040.1 flavodoxin [Chelonobacter oris]UOO81350.1 NAD(P)H-dependent oxidoreductase [Uruburuella testudinis]